MKEQSIKFISYIINKFLVIININKFPFKGVKLSILILILVITSLIIRLDYIFNILKNISYEVEFIIRICSALYNIFSLFVLILGFKYFILLSKYYFKRKSYKIKIENSNYYLYLLYFVYMLFANVILYILNYYSIISLNIQYLEFIFLFSTSISLIFGVYYSVYKHAYEIDLNRSISLFGKICLTTLFIIYLSFLIGIKFNLFSDLFSKWENLGIIKKVYCEGNSGGSNNIDSKLKAPDDSKITSDKTRYNFTNATNNIVAGDNSTITNNNINPGQSSTPQVKATISKKEVITSTIIGSKSFRTQTVSREELTTIYDNSSNNSSKSSLSFYTREAFNMFNTPLKSHSVERSADFSLRILGKTKEDSPFLREGIAGIINNLDQYKDLPPVNNTPLSQLSDLPYLNQVSPVEEENELFIKQESKSELSHLNVSPTELVTEEVRSKWSKSTNSLVKEALVIQDKIINVRDKELPSISTGEVKSNFKSKIFNFFSLKKVFGGRLDSVTSVQPTVKIINKLNKLPLASSQPNLQHDGIALVPELKNSSTQVNFSSYLTESPESGIYDINYSKSKIAKRFKSLPDLIKHNNKSLSTENILSDYKYINYVLRHTLGTANSGALFEYSDNNLWIEYDSQIENKRGFIFVNRNKINPKEFDFELVPVKQYENLSNYLNIHGEKYRNKEIMIKATEAIYYYKLNDIKTIFNPTIL
jgi:hypothetical protein